MRGTCIASLLAAAVSHVAAAPVPQDEPVGSSRTPSPSLATAETSRASPDASSPSPPWQSRTVTVPTWTGGRASWTAPPIYTGDITFTVPIEPTATPAPADPHDRHDFLEIPDEGFYHLWHGWEDEDEDDDNGGGEGGSETTTTIVSTIILTTSTTTMWTVSLEPIETTTIPAITLSSDDIDAKDCVPTCPSIAPQPTDLPSFTPQPIDARPTDISPPGHIAPPHRISSDHDDHASIIPGW